MKNLLAFTILAIALLENVKTQAQIGTFSTSPRIIVYGEATKEVEPDVIVAYLNIYDANYDVSYDPKRLQNLQQITIDRIGCGKYMTNPTYAGLKSYTGTGGFELRFKSRAEFDETVNKCMNASTEEVTVSLDYSFAEISDVKKQQIKDQLLDLAIADGKKRADKLATGTGVRLGGVIYAEEIPDYGAYAYDGEGYGNYLNAFSVKVVVKVQLHYEILK